MRVYGEGKIRNYYEKNSLIIGEFFFFEKFLRQKN